MTKLFKYPGNSGRALAVVMTTESHPAAVNGIICVLFCFVFDGFCVDVYACFSV